jgi:hypothetical protein
MARLEELSCYSNSGSSPQFPPNNSATAFSGGVFRGNVSMESGWDAFSTGDRPLRANPHAPRFDDPNLPAEAFGGKLRAQRGPQRILALRPVATIHFAGTFTAKQEDGFPRGRSGLDWHYFVRSRFAFARARLE